MAWDIDNSGLYNPDHFVVQHMYDADHAAVVWFGFMPGQALKEHQTSSVAIIQVLKGRVEVDAGETVDLATGQAIELKENQRHAVTAFEQSLVQLILVPHPRFHSLADTLNLSQKTT